VSFLTGSQAPQNGLAASKWDFNATDIVLDYNITQVKNLVITPGFSYRRQAYDDRKYVNEAIREGFFNAKVFSQTISATLRADYRLFHEKLRLLAAARMDKFNYPSKLYWSWEFAATYKITDKHILRIVESRANQCPLILNNYYNLSIAFYNPVLGAGTVQLFGNKDLQLLTTDMLEIGYRGKLRDDLEVDLEVFGSTTKNFVNMVFWQYDTTPTTKNFFYRFENIPLVAKQFGATVSLTYISPHVQLRPFFTVQYTSLANYSRYSVSPSAPTTIISPNASVNNYNSGLGTETKHVATPALYGGVYCNFTIFKNLNVNLNPYFMTASKQLEAANLTYNDGRHGVESIPPKFIMNVVASYTFINRLTLFMNFKNVFSDKTREFYRGDIPGFKVSGGINFEW
jgi:iron complex outermembrane receptor protein